MRCVAVVADDVWPKSSSNTAAANVNDMNTLFFFISLTTPCRHYKFKKGAVGELAATICSGVPVAMISPPKAPPSGPMSTR